MAKKHHSSLPGEDDRAGADEQTMKVEDKRHWARERDADDTTGEETRDAPSTTPSFVDELRLRAEAAEHKLRDYIAAFQQARTEHEQFRERLLRDVDRRVDLKFGELVENLVEGLDDLDLALTHVEAASDDALARGVALARDRFVAALARHGVVRIDVAGADFDPNVAEAIRLDPVSDPALDGKVTTTLRPGYRIGERVFRPARVAVGRLAS
jgi:molecular chaperone GrpE